MSHLANYRASLEPGSGFVDDLASLTTLDESNLLRELQTRYDNNIIYVSSHIQPHTGVGAKIKNNL